MLYYYQYPPIGDIVGGKTMCEHHHHHNHESTKTVLNRMSRAIGHLEAVKKMVEEDRDCSEVLIQIAAVKSAINNIGKIILKDHIEHCVFDAVTTGDKRY